MSYYYENDPTQVKVNLQSTVSYLLSLHKNEAEWNLLGLKVIGHVDELPIPDGNYEYGDVYTIGTAAPYDMWVFTRADDAHAEDYWFDIGKFPMPGPQGPAGPSLIDVTDFQMDAVQRVDYDATTGADVESAATLKYKDPNTGEAKQDTIDAMKIKLPIVAGDYISIDANSDNDAIEVKVDDTALALDYIPINKTQSSVVPRCQNGKVNWTLATSSNAYNSIMMRDSKGNTVVNNLYTAGIANLQGKLLTSSPSIYYACTDPDIEIGKSSTDSGYISGEVLNSIWLYPQRRIRYDGKIYYRYDRARLDDGTINYIHLDANQDGAGGYQASGKCFSITVSSRGWRVVDLKLGSGRTTHNIKLTDGTTGYDYYFTLTNSHPESYTDNASGLLASIGEARLPMTAQEGSELFAGMMEADGDYYHCYYGQGIDKQFTKTQVFIEDTIT